MRYSKPKQISMADLDFILGSLHAAFDTELRNEKVLLTGATGFFGKWLTQTFLAANDRFRLKNEFTILTRDRASALTHLPWLIRRPDVKFIESDIRYWEPGSSNTVYSTIIHGAATASRSLNEKNPTEMFDTIVEGTKRVLQCAQNSRRLLFISSGAVYGPQTTNCSEDNSVQPGPYSAYAEAKRVSETLCLAANGKIARCFAFLGPYLPLETHFAAGNFTASALSRETISIGGDGTPLRSYLYASDLTIWLLTILLRAKPNSTYNVGSDQSLSIFELAQKFSAANSKELPLPVEIAKRATPGAPVERYVPSIEKANKELNLAVWTSLDEAIAKTLAWHRSPGP